MAPATRPRQVIVVGGVPEHFNLPWKLAIARGVFRRIGLEVVWVDEPAGTGALTASLAAGDLDLATVLTEGMVAAIDRGLDAHLERLYVESPLWWGIHVPNAFATRPLSDIPHRRIAISRKGSGSHLMAYVLATREGWRIDADTFVTVGGLTGGVTALKDETADVFLWETYMTKPFVDRAEVARAGEIPTPWPAFVVARRRGFGAPRAAKVLDALQPVVDAFVQDAGTPDLLAREVGISPDDARVWLSRTRFAHGERLSHRALGDVRDQLRAAGAS